MPDGQARIFEAARTRAEALDPSLPGPWRDPLKRLAERAVGGRASLHDDASVLG